MSEIHNYVIFNAQVCVTTNRRRIDALDLYRRLVEKYGPECAEERGACFTVYLTQEQVHAVLTPQELAPPPLVDVPAERHGPTFWRDVPLWAQCYIEEMERLLGVDPSFRGLLE